MSICADIFVNLLKNKNLQFSTGKSGNDDVVDVPYDGKVFRCFFGGEKGEYLSIYYVYETVPEGKVADVLWLCNQLNVQYKWVTFFLDNKNSLVLHDDAILSTSNAGEEAFELILRFVSISKNEKEKIMKTIYA